MLYGFRNPWMDRMLGDLNGLIAGNGRAGGYPKVNAYGAGDTVVLNAELPGVAPEAIKVSVQENVVTIAGELPAQALKPGESWHRNERPTGQFQREFRLPFRIDPAKVEAESRHGVLTVTLHRLEEDKPRTINVRAA